MTPTPVLTTLVVHTPCGYDPSRPYLVYRGKGSFKYQDKTTSFTLFIKDSTYWSLVILYLWWWITLYSTCRVFHLQHVYCPPLRYQVKNVP